MDALAMLVLVGHLIWLGMVIFGALWTRGRPFWSAAHLLALIWGIVVEVGPWPCPLTLAEQYFGNQAGLHDYQGGFLLHCLSSVIYPDLPGSLVAAFGVAVCSINLGIYLWRFSLWLRRR